MHFSFVLTVFLTACFAVDIAFCLLAQTYCELLGFERSRVRVICDSALIKTHKSKEKYALLFFLM